jgi:hypothetical protein
VLPFPQAKKYPLAPRQHKQVVLLPEILTLLRLKILGVSQRHFIAQELAQVYHFFTEVLL